MADGPMTRSVVPNLTRREIDFAVTYARHLLDGSTRPPPTYAEIAHLWSVSPKTVDNTLQNLKQKLTAADLPPTASTAEMIALLVDIGKISFPLFEHADLDSPTGPTSTATG